MQRNLEESVAFPPEQEERQQSRSDLKLLEGFYFNCFPKWPEVSLEKFTRMAESLENSAHYAGYVSELFKI